MKYRTQNWIILTTGTVRKVLQKDLIYNDCRGEGTMFSKCPSLPIDLNQNNAVSREEFGSLRDEISDIIQYTDGMVHCSPRQQLFIIDQSQTKLQHSKT
jgi:hypothetical protein